jgi:hypothetical protein
VLSRIFGPKRDELTSNWRLHNEEFHNLYSSPSIIRTLKEHRRRWEGRVAIMAEKRNAYRILVGKPQGKSPLGRPNCRWENVKIDPGEIGWGGMAWTDLAKDRNQWRASVNSVINLLRPKNSAKFFSSYTARSFSKRTHLHEFS